MLPGSYAAAYEGNWRCSHCTALHVIKVTMGSVDSVAVLDEMGVPLGRFPPPVSACLREMVAAFNAGAIMAAAVMLRRGLECACIENGAIGRTLADKVIDLRSKGLLIADTEQAMARATRLFGNYGAHPGDDGLGELSRKEVARAIDLGVHLLERLYP